jgi:hypothetical protein
MDKSLWLVIAVLAGLVVFGIFLSWYTDRKQTFDERQLLIRAKAYRIGYISLIVAVIAITFLQTWEKWTSTVDTPFAMLSALMFSLMVFGVYCVTHDAFFHRTDNPKAYLGICIAVMLLNVLAVIRHVKDNGTLFVGGKLTLSPGGNMLFSGMFLVLVITIVIKMILVKREDEE